MATILVMESCDKGDPGASSASGQHNLYPLWQKRLPTSGGYTRTHELAGIPEYNTSIKKTGAGSWRFSKGASSDSRLKYTPTTNWGKTIYWGWWVYIPTGALNIGESYILATLSDGTNEATIRYSRNVDDDKGISTQTFWDNSDGGSGFTFDTWHWVEVRCVASSITVWLDGVQTFGSPVTAVTGDLTYFRIGSWDHEASKETSDIYIDGLIASSDTALAFADGWVVTTGTPDGDDGTDTAFTPSTGSVSWSLIEEAPPNSGGAADYVSSTADSQNELVTLDASLVPANATAICVKTVLHVCFTNDPDPVDATGLAVRTNDGGTATNNAMESGLVTAQTYQYAVIDNVRPNGGGAWSQANVDAFKIGGARVTSAAANLNIDQAFIEVAYKLILPVPLMHPSLRPQVEEIANPVPRRSLIQLLSQPVVATSPLAGYLLNRHPRLAPESDVPPRRNRPVVQYLVAPVVAASSRRRQVHST